VDLLRSPLIGPVLRWRHCRRTLQLIVLAIAAAIVLHGLFGPGIAPRNLSTVLTSIHWRGLLVLSLLLLGNLACTACPLVLARDAGRRLIAPRLSWPRRLRRKWLGIGLLILVLFSYELFDLWSMPAATAWLILGYFGLALAIDLLFRGASFCKHVCPVGQFNFIASTMAPTELQVRDGATCQACRTHDCIKGRPAAPPRASLRGCELGLFLPAKVGNLDCTLCLDCVRACPHDNIALVARVPGLELLDTRRRSGLGRLARRPDLAALAIVFTFAALVNAFSMTGPSASLERSLATVLHLSSEAAALAIVFLLGLVLLPGVLLLPAAAATRAATRDADTPLGSAAWRYAFALVPIGFGVWLAHYGFHFFTGALTVIPVAQSAVIDLVGQAAIGEPSWRWAGMAPGTVYPIQLGFVLLGACGSLGLVHATSVRDYPRRSTAASASWFVVVLALAAAAMWIFNQPMEMRGLGGLG
jgi:polyferredoxin